jgi:hypothetical protein
VARNGGGIGLANWTPKGFIGQLFQVIGAYTPRPVDSSRLPCGAPSCTS